MKLQVGDLTVFGESKGIKGGAIVAKFLPLYYVNEGLRNAMIYLNESETIYHSSFVLVIAVILFIAGVLLTKWKED